MSCQQKMRLLRSVLRDNVELRRNLIFGSVIPEKLTLMSEDDLKPAKLKEQEKEIMDTNQASRQLNWYDENKSRIKKELGIKDRREGMFTCPKRGSKETESTQTQVDRADEPMTIFIRCVKCNNR